MKQIRMWETTPALAGEEPVLEYYPAENKRTDATVVILPGGGYTHRAKHEGEGYALLLNSMGLDAFVCEYRVLPYTFPVPLLDARRAIRYVRAHAAEYGVNPDRIAVMGSSAGGHLAALVANYRHPIEHEGVDELDLVSPFPNATIHCYAVSHYPDGVYVQQSGSFGNLMGAGKEDTFPSISPDLLVTEDTPPAFLWHTSKDSSVTVRHSYLYAMALSRFGIPHELHVFPFGGHGMGVAPRDPHVAQWTGLLKNWLTVMGWLPEADRA